MEGNMVRDPLLRTTPNGKQVCNFTIATNRFYKHDANMEKEVGFFDVEAWGKLAESSTAHGRKGRGVRVVGRLKQDRWAGSDGKNHTKVAIVAEHIEYHPDFRKAEDNYKKPAPRPSGTNSMGSYPPYDDADIEELRAVNF
jgi:single-strand DNA-binding protein